jgi:DNA modification methylase
MTALEQAILLLNSDARHIPLTDQSVQCVVTSPPYWGLRDYGTAQWVDGDPACDHVYDRTLNGRSSTLGGTKRSQIASNVYNECRKCGAVRIDAQIGLERTPQEYVASIVAVMREVWRVLRPNGTLWLNLGDSYANDTKGGGTTGGKHVAGLHGQPVGRAKRDTGLKSKDLVGIPWRVAFALQDAGWYLRSDIIWSKPNPMPESVTDRPTKSHEYIFLLTKSERYYYDAEAIMEDCSASTHARISQDLSNQVGSFRANGGQKTNGPMKAVIRGSTRKLAEAGSGVKQNLSFETALALMVEKRNKRTVWTVGSTPYSGAHFATFPPALVEPMILAGTSPQACEHCGAPWARVTEKGLTAHDGKTKSAYAKGTTAHRMSLLRQAARERGEEYTNARTTVGWEPTCECEGNTGAGQCIVLDPFSGSGTVGRVAAKHGRRFVGLELNPAYIELAQNRTSKVQTAFQL